MITAVVLGGERVTVEIDGVPALQSWLRRFYVLRSTLYAPRSTDLVVRVDGVWRGRRLWKRASSFAEFRAYLEWSLITVALERIQKRHAVLHAACVVKGRATALIVGRHGAGKTTLAMALGKRGWRVVVDDVLAVATGGKLIPIARPLSV